MVQKAVPVLIVGGGIVGLSAALFLLQQEVPCLLVERRRSTSVHPRARGVNMRTMELYRELGLDETVCAAGASLAPAIGILKGETLAQALEDFQAPPARTAFSGMLGAFGEISTANSARITQDLLEPVLLDAIRERNGEVSFSTELLSFTQDVEGVTAHLLDRTTGEQRSVRAQYLLAADGANSPLRQQLQAPVSGRGVLGHLLNILFKADLRALTAGREFSLCRIDNPSVRGLFTSINFLDTWVFHAIYHPENGERPEQFSPERCKELVQAALGLPELAVEIRSVLPWESAMRVMDSFQYGRIFFAGDAAHQMPPWGGQGANSGIADVHNLAWKLAAVLKGQAGVTLLESYTAERHPVDYLAAEESALAADESGLMMMAGNPGAGMAARFPRIMGYYAYEAPSHAILAEDTATPTQHPVGLDGRPGTRAPHLWLERQGQLLSTLDLFGTQFVLLSGAEGQAWCYAARALAGRLELPLAAYRLAPDGDLVDAARQWPERAGIEPGGALLVRPDGVVAWRSPSLAADPEAILQQVLTYVLNRA